MAYPHTIGHNIYQIFIYLIPPVSGGIVFWKYIYFFQAFAIILVSHWLKRQT